MRIESFEIPAHSVSEPRSPDARLAICHEIRRIVFVDEQGVSSELEWDNLDAPAIHLLAVDDETVPQPKPLGTARLRFINGQAKAERVAVHRDTRGAGVGRALMLALEDIARSAGASRVRLNAQIDALLFYEQLGYRGEGERFVEAGIPHIAMSKSLSGED